MQAPYGYDVGPRKYEEANSVVKVKTQLKTLSILVIIRDTDVFSTRIQFVV